MILFYDVINYFSFRIFLQGSFKVLFLSPAPTPSQFRALMGGGVFQRMPHGRPPTRSPGPAVPRGAPPPAAPRAPGTAPSAPPAKARARTCPELRAAPHRAAQRRGGGSSPAPCRPLAGAGAGPRRGGARRAAPVSLRTAVPMRRCYRRRKRGAAARGCGKQASSFPVLGAIR